MKIKKKKIIFIASTGGHLTELLRLKKLIEKNESYIVTENLLINKSLTKKYNASFLLYGARNYLIRYIFKFIINCFISFYLYLKIRPEFIISTGAHTSVPMSYIGKCFGSKIIFIETFAKINTPTISGRLIYPIADRFYIQWNDLKKHYPKAIYKGGLF